MAGSHEVTGSNPVFSTIFCDLFSLIHTYFEVIVDITYRISDTSDTYILR